MADGICGGAAPEACREEKMTHAWPRVQAGESPAGEHPLETAWTLWVDKKTTDRKEQSAYMEGLKQLGTFQTIEGFLRLLAFIKKPSTFPRDYNLLCFRNGCKPMWEEFPDGGCWNYRMRRSGGADDPVDHSWESLIIACIGESFETPDVVGCVMSSRVKEIAVSVWNASNTNDPQVRFKIGEQMRKVLSLSANALLEYKNHQSSMQDFSTYRNAQVYIMRSDICAGTRS
mmetsp:Transcript_143133/g.398840  ORF Transcript_143133/g.398840 Transcript_143133/m.398840 type:complete len:230 (-) Transcript_143133:124-813(-)